MQGSWAVSQISESMTCPVKLGPYHDDPQGRAQNTKTLLLRQSHGQNEAWMYNVWVGKTKDSKCGGNFGRIRMGEHDGSATDVGAIRDILHDSLDLIVS